MSKEMTLKVWSVNTFWDSFLLPLQWGLSVTVDYLSQLLERSNQQRPVDLMFAVYCTTFGHHRLSQVESKDTALRPCVCFQPMSR